MKPLMYRHRPAIPALIGAIASLLAGLFCFAMIYQLVRSGEVREERLTALILVSVSITGICLIAAFARHQFTHLWAKPRARTQKKESEIGSRSLLHNKSELGGVEFHDRGNIYIQYRGRFE